MILTTRLRIISYLSYSLYPYHKEETRNTVVKNVKLVAGETLMTKLDLKFYNKLQLSVSQMKNAATLRVTKILLEKTQEE